MSDQTIDLGTEPAMPEVPGARLHGERYRDEGLIATGGMGEVRRVYDHTLQRSLAMKIIRWSLLERPSARERFFEEARITARLNHPGIMAIHDVGQLEDGRLWYTMPVVEGATFTQAARALHSGSHAHRWRGWNRHRLLAAFQRACSAVAYAHSRGVIHRDIKPDNMMIGPFDEVLVLDWGIAAVQALQAAAAPSRGRPLGTPAFMPPEQASGGAVTAASDVYALGVSLYTLLTGVLPWAVAPGLLLSQLRRGERPPLRPADNASAPLPPALRELFEQAIVADPAQRPSITDFNGALQDWLDGSSRRRRALSVVAEAAAMTPDIATLRAEAAALRRQARDRLAGIRPHDPLPAKAPAWALEDAVTALERRIAHAETLYLHTLHSALNHDPELDEAHRRLADAYFAQMQAAERRSDPEALARLEVFLRAHDRGRHADFLDGTGTLAIITEPPGATVTLHRYTEQTRRLDLVPHSAPAQAPLVNLRLPAGSYLAVLEAPGCAPARYPVWLGRGAAWQSAPPGETAPRPVRLLPAGVVRSDEAFVPAGWFRSGGDRQAVDGLPHCWRWVDDFVVRRDPVTNREYIAWLDALWAAGRHEEALRHQPSSRHTEHAYRQDPDGTFHPGEASGNWALDAPVVLVDWHAAVAYAADLAAETGEPWRLLLDQEWEKAARGVDGRRFPWGDHFDPRRASMARSAPGRPCRASVSAFPDDESPYGVRGMAGNVRDWCANPYRRDGPAHAAVSAADRTDGDDAFRMSRGGSWSSSNDSLCRLASRFAGSPELRLVSLGFRLARSV